MIGGGAKRPTLAGREADIVSLNFKTAGASSARPASTAEATDERIEWIKAGAGDRFDDIELEVAAYFVTITEEPDEAAAKLAASFGVDAATMRSHPNALFGSVEQICDDLQARRERFGISYVTVATRNMEAFAPWSSGSPARSSALPKRAGAPKTPGGPPQRGGRVRSTHRSRSAASGAEERQLQRARARLGRQRSAGHAEIGPAQPPIWLIERFGRMNCTWPMAWPAHFVPTARSISAARSSSLPPPRRMRPQVELARLEQARAELALGREPHPVAVAAERLRDASG